MVSNWNLHTNVKVKMSQMSQIACGELDHIKRNCPKGSIKKIEEKNARSFYVKASIGDSVYIWGRQDNNT